MLFGNLKEGVKIEGVMPERALLRLKRGGIALYNVQKIGKEIILLRVKRKDIQKVFAIYPNVCYNNTAYHPYRVRDLGGVGFAKAVDFCKQRAGFLLGGLLFCATTLAADSLVFGVEVVGSTVYKREALQALDEEGIKPFSRYPKDGGEDVVAKLLSLRGIEFCSVQKVGYRVRVELRNAPLSARTLQKGQMQAKHTGEILSISVLRGSALKKIGDTVTLGEPMVGDWFSPKEGEQVRVEPIARVRISCVYEGIHTGERESAFAEAYLALGLGEKDEIVTASVLPVQNGFEVKIDYLVTESMNM